MAILDTLHDDATREAHKLVDAALSVAALGNMFSREARLSAAQFLTEEARRASNGANEPEEARILLAMARYFIGDDE